MNARDLMDQLVAERRAHRLHTWTTGTGQGDPADTGVHTCKVTGPHGDDHRCECGMTAPA